jgi:hypothetical protein
MTDDAKGQGDLLLIQIHRAQAINAYAAVEQSLCRLFGSLIGTNLKLAAVVFYRITNTHSRNRIIDDLLNERHGKAYEAYWNGIPNTPNRNGMFTIIRQLDQSRNEIVHWHMSSKFVPGTIEPSEIGLMKPDVWPISYDPDNRTISSNDLVEFIWKADFASRSLNMFFLYLQGSLGAPNPLHATWREIFGQPAFYPPPDTNPLSRNWKAPQTPPQSSEG